MDNYDQSQINEYKRRLADLGTKNQELERKMILLEEQKKQYQEKIMQAFQTTEPDALQKIADKYIEDIKLLEEQLNGTL